MTLHAIFIHQTLGHGDQGGSIEIFCMAHACHVFWRLSNTNSVPQHVGRTWVGE